ncbi:hypothetical protein VKT23_001355 [Stygiomarasmius scandens]|uniref:F-box domain-containing protein n=1 Tax=Marasmiellus scandens TaxID=2682957 RepID=A0ABR1K8R6_9AGAR
MLWDFRSRWSRVTLKGFFSPQDCPSSAGFDNLEYLDISELLVDSDFPDVFKRAPKLITSCINDFDNDFPLPFSQLRCIQCNKAQNTQHIIDCLTTCTGLLQALITTEDRFISSVPEPSIVTHYGLTSLDLGVHQLEATHIFSHLCLPALVELSLRLISSSPRRPTSFSEIIPNLRSFLDRSSCQLRTLILGMSTEVPAENSNFFSEVFALTPTINHLTIYALDFESPLDNLIHSLALHPLEMRNTNSLPKRPPLLPWLTSLDLRFRLRNKGWSLELLPTLVPPNLDLILSMVRSRWCSPAEFEPMTKLASFQFYLEIPPYTMPSVYDLAHKFSDDFEPGLRMLEKDGLQLSVGLISSMFSGPAVV